MKLRVISVIVALVHLTCLGSPVNAMDNQDQELVRVRRQVQSLITVLQQNPALIQQLQQNPALVQQLQTQLQQQLQQQQQQQQQQLGLQGPILLLNFLL